MMDPQCCKCLSSSPPCGAALFAGAALYINVAEHPARMALETRSAAQQWAPSYKRATWMQAPSALLSFLGGVGAWLVGAGTGWLVAAVLIGAVVPFTLIGIMPTNHKLLAPGRDLGSAETRALLERWGSLHAVRTTLSILATLVYMWLLVQ
jgi:Anthrone oxygenase